MPPEVVAQAKREEQAQATLEKDFERRKKIWEKGLRTLFTLPEEHEQRMELVEVREDVEAIGRWLDRFPVPPTQEQQHHPEAVHNGQKSSTSEAEIKDLPSGTTAVVGPGGGGS
jgi:hypothetical protein